MPNEPQNHRVDLTSYDIYVEEDFFVSIEWIEDLGVEGLWFSAGVFGKFHYACSASHAQWVKQRALSIGMERRVIAKKELRILFFNNANRVFNDLFKHININIT